MIQKVLEPRTLNPQFLLFFLVEKENGNSFNNNNYK